MTCGSASAATLAQSSRASGAFDDFASRYLCRAGAQLCWPLPLWSPAQRSRFPAWQGILEVNSRRSRFCTAGGGPFERQRTLHDFLSPQEQAADELEDEDAPTPRALSEEAGDTGILTMRTVCQVERELRGYLSRLATSQGRLFAASGFP